MGEILLIMIVFLVGGGAVTFATLYFLAKSLTIIGGKTCPYCAEKIKKDAKICRYCQQDVANVEIENQPPRGLFK